MSNAPLLSLVTFLPLAGAEDGEAFESVLAGALDLEPVPGRPLRPQILALLQAQERLLVLDNMEQLTGESAWLHELLTRCQDREVQLVLAGLRGPVRDVLTRSGFVARLGERHLPCTVHEAVTGQVDLRVAS